MDKNTIASMIESHAAQINPHYKIKYVEVSLEDYKQLITEIFGKHLFTEKISYVDYLLFSYFGFEICISKYLSKTQRYNIVVVLNTI